MYNTDAEWRTFEWIREEVMDMINLVEERNQQWHPVHTVINSKVP